MVDTILIYNAINVPPTLYAPRQNNDSCPSHLYGHAFLFHFHRQWLNICMWVMEVPLDSHVRTQKHIREISYEIHAQGKVPRLLTLFEPYI